MLKGIRLFAKPVLLLALFLVLSSSAIAAEQPDTTKEREPYPEQKSIGQALWTVPQFVINIPVEILTGFSQVIIDDLYAGHLIAQIAAMVGDLDRIWGFYPVIGAGSNSGIEYGLAFTSKGVFTVEERLKIKGWTSSHDYQNFKVRYKAPKMMNENLRLIFLGQYSKSPWESYFGPGHLSLQENEVNYNPEHSLLSAVAVWKASNSITVDFKLAYDAYNLYGGEDPDLVGDLDSIRQLHNLTLADTRNTRLISFGGTIDHDWRNDKGQPTAGGREILSFYYNASTEDGDELKYTFVSVDLRQYFHLFRKRALAVRAMGRSTDLGDNSPVMPFYLKPTLGGAETLRGYTNYRFSDNDLAVISVEYRYPIWDQIDAFVFLDEGRVFNSITDHFKWHDWKYSYGGGLRVWETDNLMLTFYAAKSKEATRFKLQFNDLF
jgi:outer membrane protein assembly factor BamA